MPKSYLADEPGCQRAAANRFDPYLQTWNRLAAFDATGHPVDKVELIVMGGTFLATSEIHMKHKLRMDPEEVVEAYLNDATSVYAEREEELTPEVLRRLERTVTLSIIDNKWREHLAEMDYLRSGIGLRAMAQKDPLVEYQREGYDMFSLLVDSVKEDTLRYMYHVKVERQQAPQRPTAIQTSGPSAKRRTVKGIEKIGRNAPCPCGSGKKYKKCCGR